MSARLKVPSLSSFTVELELHKLGVIQQRYCLHFPESHSHMNSTFQMRVPSVGSGCLPPECGPGERAGMRPLGPRGSLVPVLRESPGRPVIHLPLQQESFLYDKYSVIKGLCCYSLLVINVSPLEVYIFY